MSSKFSRLLLSTCLPLAAFSVFAMSPANAGFEWVAPEPVQPAPEILPEHPAPEVEQDALPLPPVQEEKPEVLPQMPVVEEEAQDYEPQDPSMKTKVMKPQGKPSSDDAISEPVFNEDSGLKAKKFTGRPKPPSDPVMPEIPTEAETKADVIPEPVQDLAPPSVPVKEDVQEIEKIEEKPDVPKSGEPEILEINPFPLQEKKGVQSESEPVVLPTGDEVKAVGTKEEINWNESETFAVVEGFGKDVPLALALGQIVPAKYAYSFGKGVNAGALVSWDGGKPWNEVLEGVLAPLNIGMQLRGKTLLLRTSGSGQVPSTETAPPPSNDVAKATAGEKKSVKIEGADQHVTPKPVQKKETKLPEKTETVIEETLKPVDAPVSSSIAPPPPVGEPETAKEEKAEKEPQKSEKKHSEDVKKPAKEDVKQEKPQDLSRKAILDPGQSVGQQPAAQDAPLPLPDDVGKKKSEESVPSPADQAEQKKLKDAVLEEAALPEGFPSAENEQNPEMQPVPMPEEVLPVVPEPEQTVLNEDVAAEAVQMPVPDMTELQDKAVEPPQPELNDAPISEITESPNVEAVAEPIPLAEEVVVPMPDEPLKADQDIVKVPDEVSVPLLEDEVKPVPVENKPADPVVLTDDIVGTQEQEQTTPETVVPDAGEKPPTPPVANTADQVRIWEASKGGDLKNVLEKWCKDTGVEFVWNTEKDYSLTQDVIISGSFETAINVLFSQAVKDAPTRNLGKEGDVQKLVIE